MSNPKPQKKWKLYDKSLSHIDTPRGTLTLVSVFLPFLVEMLLTNSITIPRFSDAAVFCEGYGSGVNIN